MQKDCLNYDNPLSNFIATGYRMKKKYEAMKFAHHHYQHNSENYLLK